MATIYEMLKKDHDKVKKLLKETIEKDDPSKFPTIKKELETHMIGEEKYFYPSLMDKDKETILESYEEHDVGKRLVMDLDRTDKRDKTWIPKLKVLKDVLNHHIEEEESELFEEAHEILNDQQEQEIAEKFEKFKSQMM